MENKPEFTQHPNNAIALKKKQFFPFRNTFSDDNFNVFEIIDVGIHKYFYVLPSGIDCSIYNKMFHLFKTCVFIGDDDMETINEMKKFLLKNFKFIDNISFQINDKIHNY